MRAKQYFTEDQYAIMKDLMAEKEFDGKSLYALGLEVMRYFPGYFYSHKIALARMREEDHLPRCIQRFRLKFFVKCFSGHRLPGPLALIQDVVDIEILHVLTNVYFVPALADGYYEAESVISWAKIWYPELVPTFDRILAFMGSRYIYYRTGEFDDVVKRLLQQRDFRHRAR